MADARNKSIGQRLRQLRETKGMSQGDVERGSGLLRSYISRVEGGYTEPSLETLAKFAKAMGLEPYQILFSGKGQPTAPKVPEQPALSQTTKEFLKLYESMSSIDRRLLLAVADKLSKS